MNGIQLSSRQLRGIADTLDKLKSLAGAVTIRNFEFEGYTVFLKRMETQRDGTIEIMITGIEQGHRSPT